MRIAGVLAAVSLVGCGSVKKNSPPDAPIGDDAPDDAPPDTAGPTRCDPTAAFGTPHVLSGINTAAGETALRLSSDGLNGILTRGVNLPTGAPIPRLFFASRATSDGVFTSVTQLNAPVNTGTFDASRGTMTDDQLTLYFESGRSNNQFDVWVSTRPNNGSDFGTPDNLALGPINTPSNDNQPFFTRTGSAMWFVRDGSIYSSARIGATFQTPVKHDELGMANSPVLTKDELEIFFADAGNADIYHATRTSTTAQFGAPAKLDALNVVDKIDQPTDVSPDGCDIYFISDRTGQGSQGGYDVYEASRPRP